LTDQLTRFASLNPHQLVGHLTNLDFWLGEVRHAFGVLDGYHPRFERLKRAQTDYTTKHGTQQFVPGDFHQTAETAARPHRATDVELKEARRGLANAAYRFLIRCHRAGLLPQKQLRSSCERLGIGVDLRDVTP